VGLFKERKTEFVLLSLLSAVAVMSTAFVGFPTYAQSDGSNLTTFKEDKNSETDVSSLFNGLVVCDIGKAKISKETQVAETLEEASHTTPTVSVQVMTETQVAEQASNERGTASASSESSTASADCIRAGGDKSTSAASNAKSIDTSSETSILSAPESNDKILVIDGQDFVPGQVVLVFSENALIGIDDVDSDGNIEAKVPMPSGDTSSGIRLQFVESGTQRSTTFEYDGQTLTAPEGSDIQAEDGSSRVDQ
jgi:predicted nucleic acid-binding protein